MKHLIVGISLFLSSLSWAAFSPEDKAEFKEMNQTLLKASQALRELSDRQLDRQLGMGPDLVMRSCSDIKDIMAHVQGRVEEMKEKMKKHSDDSVKELKTKLSKIESLSQDALKQCSEPEVGWTLDKLREETMAAGFLLQSIEFKKAQGTLQ